MTDVKEQLRIVWEREKPFLPQTIASGIVLVGLPLTFALVMFK